MRPKYASTKEEGEISTTYGIWTREDFQPSRRRIFLLRYSSSCAAEQYHSDASLEAVDWQVSNNSKKWQMMMEADISMQGSKPVLDASDWPYKFLQAVGSILVYCYRYTIVGFVNLSLSAESLDCVEGYFYTGFPSRQTIDGWVCNGLKSTGPGKLIGTKLSFQMKHVQFVGP